MAKKSQTKKPPYEFVMEELSDLPIYTKPMFGCLAVYLDEKIVFILRQKKNDIDNGIWLATIGEHHASLQKDFPSMRSIEIFGPGPTGWQVLPEESEDFEEAALRACKFVRARDPRIGKIPKKKKVVAKKKTGKRK